MVIFEMLNTPAARMVGETLLHSLWQSVLVACFLVGFFWYFKRVSAPVRYTISFSALCFCLLLPLVTYTALIFQTDSTPSQAAQPLTTRSNLSSPTAISQKTFRTSADDYGAHISSGVLEATPAHENSRSIGWRKSLRQVLPVVVAVWLTGILSLGIRLVLGLRTAHRLRTRFVAHAPTELETAARRLATTLKVQQPVSLRVSKVVDVPLVVGYLKPLILIPTSALTGMSRPQLEMLIAHELAHVRRFDHLANLLQNVVETLLFFNPAVWWISNLVRHERECCCDALAVRACGGDTFGYARTLATLNTIQTSRRFVVTASGGSLLGRVRRLAGGTPEPRLQPTHWLVGVTLISLSTLMVSVANAQAQGGTLRIAYASIQQLDPYKSAASDEIVAFSQIFDPLITFSEDDYRPVPHLAESWEATDDTTWVFRLRQGVTFQDGNDVFPEGKGRELAADDVVYSINRFLEVSTAFTLGDIEAVTAPDRYTVQIETAAPDPFLVTDPNRLGRVLIVPREAIEQLGEEAFARNPIGSGPFELVSFTPDQSLEFTRNEDYWLPTNLDGVEFVFIPDPTVQTIALESGEVDVIPYIFNVDSVAQLSENPELVLHEGFGSYRGLGFNVTTPPFDELAVRDAISKAIDIDGAVAAVVAPFGTRAYGQVAPWTGFETDPSLAELWEYNPEAALAELEGAGFTDSDGDGVLDRDGGPLSFGIKTIAGSHVRVLTILVTQLQELGIDARVLQQDGAVWGDDLQTGNDTGVFFDYSFSGVTGLYSLFHSSNNGRTNTHFYSNAEVDRLLDEASRTLNFVRRNDLWLEAQQLIMRDRAGIPLYFENGYAITSSRVQDFAPGVAGLHLVSTENNVSLSE